MDKILDPECPGLFRQNNVWMASTNKATLCDSRCLKALCQLQEQAKTSVTGEQLVWDTPCSILLLLASNVWCSRQRRLVAQDMSKACM
jgi:hypothetical protein